MARPRVTDATVFRVLCKILGGQDTAALTSGIAAGLLPQLIAMARAQDLLPALAVRCDEQALESAGLGAENAGLLKQALLDNTRRNMEIIAQAIRITRRLNQAGITPLFLKGTARLLSAGNNHLGFRKQSDIDLLVKPEELAAAGDVFLADGYCYCRYPAGPTGAPQTLADTAAAIRLSASHHHLPPLAKAGYATTVELHRHFLDRPFQRANPLPPLFGSATDLHIHGASFMVPSAEYQLIHLVLGTLVTDGAFDRRTFPIRGGCDLIEIAQGMTGTHSDWALVQERCGRYFPLFLSLVMALMDYSPRAPTPSSDGVPAYLWLMQQRFDHPVARRLLDGYARAGYLARALRHSPAKLPAYLRGKLAPARV
ncbi:MAG: nucleotidyltransferase family protein [Halioglobus sp.]